MKKISAILSKLLLIAKDAKVWLRVLVFVIVGTVCLVAGAIAFSKTKVKKEDCTYYIEQNKQLVGALIEIKTELQATPTSYIDNGEWHLTYASFIDTIPKQKQSAQVNKVLSKIDSILLKIKTDSLKLKKSKA